MPIRWVIGPVVEDTNALGDRVRYPKVGRILDPARPGKYVKHATVYGPVGTSWCLSFIRAKDFSLVDADPQIVSLFEGLGWEDGDKALAKPMREYAWDAERVRRLRERLAALGVDVATMTNEMPLWEIIRAVGQRLDPYFEGPKGTWVGTFREDAVKVGC